MKNRITIFLLVALIVLFSSCSEKESVDKHDNKDTIDYKGKIHSEVILDTTTTAVGETIVYPDGQARILSAKITIPPNAETGWHTHGAPIYGYIVKGTLEVEYKDKGKKQFTAGSAIVDALNVEHNGKAYGDEPVVLIVVFSSAVGVKPTIPVE